MFKGLNAICKTFVLHTPAWGFQSTSTACCVVFSREFPSFSCSTESRSPLVPCTAHTSAFSRNY